MRLEFNIMDYINQNADTRLTNTFTRAAKIRLHVNVHPFIDIPTGHALEGTKDDEYINGGIAPFTGIGGVPNMFKSAKADDAGLAFLNNFFPFSEGHKFDTEDSATINRMSMFRNRFDMLNGEGGDEYIRQRVVLTNTNRQEGGDQAGGWWRKTQLHAKNTRDRKKRPKMYETPFIVRDKDDNGKETTKPHKALMLIFSIIDSMSELPIEKVTEMFDKNEVGHSDNNTEAMRGGSAKTQLIRQIPGFSNEYKWYIIATAHLGKRVEMDPNRPPQDMLAYLRGLNFKHTPEKFAFLTNNCFLMTKSKPLLQERFVEYPYDPEDEMTKNDTDLLRITTCNTRGKNGPSGMDLFYIVSQRDGIDWDLTSWVHLREKGNYGIVMKGTGFYHLDLCPDITVTRRNVRKTIRENHKFRQALRMTISLRQMKDYWSSSYPHHMDPIDVYNALEARGIDWDLFYDTREYWTYRECEDLKIHRPAMNALMMLRMAREPDYKPHWWDAAIKEKAKVAAKTDKEESA